MELSIDQKIESLLFFKGEPVSKQFLMKNLGISEEECDSGILSLKEKLSDRGISLIENNNEISLVTHPEMGELIEELTKEELQKDLSKAALETLSIILYRAPIKRSEIDYIRGVNSQFILRNLSVRGLIEKKTDPKDERTYTYSPSTELLQMLGITDPKELPEFEKVQNDIEAFIRDNDDEVTEQKNTEE